MSTEIDGAQAAGIMTAVAAGIAAVFRWMLGREVARIDETVESVEEHEQRIASLEAARITRDDLDRTENKIGAQVREMHADLVSRLGEIKPSIDTAHRRIDDIMAKR